MKRLFASLLIVVHLVGCGTEDAPTDSTEAERPSAPKDTPRSAAPSPEKAQSEPVSSPFAARLRQAHATADAAHTDAERRAASDQLLLALDDADEAEAPTEVRDDLAGRAALLRLQAGEVKQARAVVERTLDKPTEPSVARANLLVVAADIEEHLGHESEARRYLMDALAMNQVLLGKELETP